jgi:ABC-type antimicrobial peptide transport system permease subunit
MRRQRLDEAAIPFMFRPGVQTQMDIAIRTLGDPTQLAAAIRREIQEVDASVPPYGVTTVEQRLGETVGVRRLQTLLLGFLAASALVLAVIGIYGLVRQSVVARTRELGVRIALGASVGSVLRMVLSGALGLAAAGLTIGLSVAFGFARALQSFLYETSPGDLATYAAVTVLLLAVTAASAVLPARRAARTDPATVLRQE